MCEYILQNMVNKNTHVDADETLTITEMLIGLKNGRFKFEELSDKDRAKLLNYYRTKIN